MKDVWDDYAGVLAVVAPLYFVVILTFIIILIK